MGRRRRNRRKPDRNRQNEPSPQGELLDDVEEPATDGDADGESGHTGAGDEPAGADDGPNPDEAPDAGGEDDLDAAATDGGGAGADDAPSREPTSPTPSGIPSGASVILGPEWPNRVAELEDIHDLEGALAVVRNERKQRPDDLPLLQAEIRLLGSLGRFDAAADPLDHLRRVADDPALVHRVAGVLQFRRGTYPEAMEELRASVAEDDSVGETFYYLGETLNRLGRVEEALEALRRAVSLDPGLGRAYSTMGRLLDRKGEPAEAALMHRKAREAER